MLDRKFGSLESYTKGGLEIVDDDPKHDAFSNRFVVVNQSKPWAKVVVGMNRRYVLGAIRAEGTSEWVTRLFKLDAPRDHHGPDDGGSRPIDGEPSGKPMGLFKAKAGQMTLLPVDAAYLQEYTSAKALWINVAGGQPAWYPGHS